MTLYFNFFMRYVLFVEIIIFFVRSLLVTPPKFQLPPSSQHSICFIFFSLASNMLYIFLFILAYSVSSPVEYKLHDNRDIFLFWLYSVHRGFSINQKNIITIKKLVIGLSNKLNTRAVVLSFLYSNNAYFPDLKYISTLSFLKYA